MMQLRCTLQVSRQRGPLQIQLPLPSKACQQDPKTLGDAKPTLVSWEYVRYGPFGRKTESLMGTKINQDGEHTAMVLIGVWQMQLCQDAPDVLFDGPFTDVEPLGDPAVRSPLSN